MSAIRAIAAVGFMLFSGCANSIQTKDYNVACTADADCAPVFEGALCGCGSCPNAAINLKDLERYNRDSTAIRNACGAVPLCAQQCVGDAIAECVANKCQRKP